MTQSTVVLLLILNLPCIVDPDAEAYTYTMGLYLTHAHENAPILRPPPFARDQNSFVSPSSSFFALAALLLTCSPGTLKYNDGLSPGFRRWLR